MIERKIIKNNFLKFRISEFIKNSLNDVPIQKVIYEKFPMGERVTVFTSIPGLIIGRNGSNIKRLTEELREKFSFENPQIKIFEVKSEYLSAEIVARIIANNLSNFGSQKFKLTGFKALSRVMDAGVMGVEIKISGKLPSSRARSWRFAKGYLKKTGYISDFVIDKSINHVTLKSGVVGIKVSIMLPDTKLPDKIEYISKTVLDEVTEDLKINENIKDLKQEEK